MNRTMTFSDAQLVAESLGGNRDAFGQMVERYQALICSLAYNATGSLAQSEDLAQETFVLAWKQLRQLREPEKFRPWLCAIARNVISRSGQRQNREPSHHAEPLETLHATAAAEPLPTERAATREEEAILWRSLEQMPETYREPLILFYREGQSVQRVAERLDLSEDAVKQMLSRGRNLLHEQVLAVVEGTLARTTPGKAFTVGVLAGLPLFTTSAKAASLGATAAAGSAAAKTAVSLGLMGAVLGPVLGGLGGIFGGWLGTKASLDSAKTPEEKAFVIKTAKLCWLLTGIFCLAQFGLIFAARFYWKTHPVAVIAGFVGLAIGFMVALIGLILRAVKNQRRLMAMRPVEPLGAASSSGWQLTAKPFEYRSRGTLLGQPLIHIRLNVHQNHRPLPAKGWIAIGDVAYGLFFAAGGAYAIAPVSIGGGFAAGVIALGGGCGVGVLALGGLGIGGWAIGGLALGWMAFGGCAVGLTGAKGGVAVARDFAVGGRAFAQHANDAAARAFIDNDVFFHLAPLANKVAIGIAVASMIPVIIVAWRQMKRRVK